MPVLLARCAYDSLLVIEQGRLASSVAVPGRSAVDVRQ